MRTRLLLLLPACVAAGFIAGRLLWQPPAESPPPPAAAPAATTLPATALGDLATGEPRSLRDGFEGARIVNFWATWCAPCRKEMPLLEQVHQQWRGRGISVVGVAIDRPEPVRTFIAEAGISYPILIGEQDAMALAEALAPRLPGLPLTVLAAPGGEVLATHVGELHPEDLDRMVRVLDAVVTGTATLAEARQRLQPP